MKKLNKDVCPTISGAVNRGWDELWPKVTMYNAR